MLACPAYSQSQLLQNIDDETAHLLDKISYSDVAVAISEYTEDSFPHRNRGFGALCAQDQELYGVLGILFSSDIFPSRTSGQSQRLLTRTILGGTRYPDVLDWSEQDIKTVSQAHQIIFGQAKHQSSEVHIFKHKKLSSLCRGHDELQQKIRSQIRTKNDSLSLLGNHLLELVSKIVSVMERNVRKIFIVDKYCPNPHKNLSIFARKRIHEEVEGVIMASVVDIMKKTEEF